MPRATAPEITVDVQLAHPSAELTEQARATITSALRYAPAPVLHARVRLTRHHDRAVERPFAATAVLDVSGHPLRAEAAAATDVDALQLLHDRLVAGLTHRLERESGNWEDRRGRLSTGEEHEWRHGDEPTHPLPYYPRPAEERQVIPHISISPGLCDVDEAAFDMAAMDYGFHLFTEAGTRQDSVLYREGDGYRLAQIEPRPDELAPHDTAVTVSVQPAPLMTVPEAIERLAVMGQPFVFFLDGDLGRGAIVYHRYDGHYGLVTPAH